MAQEPCIFPGSFYEFRWREETVPKEEDGVDPSPG